MKHYTVRVYYGHDCSSHDGFNNGHYLDNDMSIEAGSVEEAEEAAIALFLERLGPAGSDWLQFDMQANGFDLYREVAWFTGDGQGLTREEYFELDDEQAEQAGCHYQYLTFTAEETDGTEEETP